MGRGGQPPACRGSVRPVACPAAVTTHSLIASCCHCPHLADLLKRTMVRLGLRNEAGCLAVRVSLNEDTIFAAFWNTQATKRPTVAIFYLITFPTCTRAPSEL